MTTHPIDTEALRARAEHVYRHGGPANAVESLAANVPEILDRLAAAEHRATRAEAQSAIRGRAVVIYRERARVAEANLDAADRQIAARTGETAAERLLKERAMEAEARIKAAQDVLSADEHVTRQMGTLGQWQPGTPAIAHDTIRRALGGDA